jgi:hypothetical protein
LVQAGIGSVFQIKTYDSYSNLRGTGGDSFIVQMSSVATGTVVGADVGDNTDGTYTVSYTPLTQGTYDLVVFSGTQTKTSTVIVEPGDATPATATSSIL